MQKHWPTRAVLFGIVRQSCTVPNVLMIEHDRNHTVPNGVQASGGKTGNGPPGAPKMMNGSWAAVHPGVGFVKQIVWPNPGLPIAMHGVAFGQPLPGIGKTCALAFGAQRRAARVATATRGRIRASFGKGEAQCADSRVWGRQGDTQECVVVAPAVGTQPDAPAAGCRRALPRRVGFLDLAR
jgi:hypothetical protein